MESFYGIVFVAIIFVISAIALHRENARKRSQRPPRLIHKAPWKGSSL